MLYSILVYIVVYRIDNTHYTIILCYIVEYCLIVINSVVLCYQMLLRTLILCIVQDAECIVYMNKKEKSSLVLTTLFYAIAINSVQLYNFYIITIFYDIV